MIRPLVETFRDIVAAVEVKVLAQLQDANSTIQHVNYQFGHEKELIQTLVQNSSDSSLWPLKYPLVYLAQDFREKIGGEFAYVPDITLWIIMISNNTDKSAQRYTKTFKPILYPIYEELLKQIERSPDTVVADYRKIPHTKIDHPFLGRRSVGGTDANTLLDYVDAIELQNMTLNINYQQCSFPLIN